MAETNLTDKHHENDEAELERLEANLDRSSVDDQGTGSEPATKRRGLSAWVIAIGILSVIGLIALLFIWSRQPTTDKTEVSVTTEKKEDGHTEGEEGREVNLEPEALEAAKLEIEGVTQRPAVALLEVTGTIEANPQQTQGVTPLVSGRVEQISASIGDRVSAGETLATVVSTEIAESYGKWREAETRLVVANRNLERVRRSENRVSILQAKARLDEAEATLRRTQRLIELKAGAGKDLIAAQTNYTTAKAEYEFQSNISLNKEIQQAEADVDTARIDALHQRQSLQALGVNVRSITADVRQVALIPIRAPLSGIVTERLIAAGSGVQAGQQMFTISNISSLWITASVPEQQLGQVNMGTTAEVKTASLGDEKLYARVTYIDPTLNEDTRTARVRLAVDNPGERLRSGMFVNVGFQTTTSSATGRELVVKTEAIQTVEGKTLVFIPKDDEPGAFEIREIEIGGEVGEYTRVTSGLEIGDKVVTKGSFTLKTAMQKGEMGEHGH